MTERKPKARISDKKSADILRAYKIARTKKSHSRPAKVISKNTVLDRVYTTDELTLILIKNGYALDRHHTGMDGQGDTHRADFHWPLPQVQDLRTKRWAMQNHEDYLTAPGRPQP